MNSFQLELKVFDIKNEIGFHLYVFHIKPGLPQIKIVKKGAVSAESSTTTGVQLSLYKVNIILSQGNDIQLHGGLSCLTQTPDLRQKSDAKVQEHRAVLPQYIL